MGTKRTAPIVVALLVASSLACGPDEPAPQLPDDDDGGVAIEGRFGLLNLVETAAGIEAHALFSQQAPSLELIDGLAWLGAVDLAHGYWSVPDSTDSLTPVSDLEVDLVWTDDRFYDVGEAVVLGGVVASRVDGWTDPDGFHDDELVFYRTTDPSSAPYPDDGIDLSWVGGVDVAAVEIEDTGISVEAVELTSHPPQHPQTWYEGTDLELSWSGGDGGEVWLTLLGDERWLTARITEGNGYLLPSETLSSAVNDAFDLCVTSTSADELEAGPGTVVVRTSRVQRVSFERSGVLTVSPDVVHLDTAVELEIVHHGGSFVDGSTTFDLGDGVSVESAEIPGGTGDTAHLLVSVAPSATTGKHDITATIGADTVVSERMLTVHLPPTETCEEAFALPEPRIYHGDLRGMVDDYSDPSACTGHTAEGPDAVYAIDVADDEVLSATMFYPDGDAVLYLAADCDHVESPVACSDTGGLNVAEFLSFAPPAGEGGTYYLVADTYGELSEEATGGYSLYVDRYAY